MSFFVGSGGQRPPSPSGDSNAQGGKAALPPRFLPAAKMLVRRTRAAPLCGAPAVACCPFWVPAARGRLHPPVIQMLGASELPISALSAAATRRLRSETRLRAQSAKIFACGKNACTAQTRRPAVRGPKRCPQLFLSAQECGKPRSKLAPGLFYFRCCRAAVTRRPSIPARRPEGGFSSLSALHSPLFPHSVKLSPGRRTLASYPSARQDAAKAAGSWAMAGKVS